MPYSQEWVQWEDDHGMTPLHVAVDLKQPDLVKTCITKGSDVNHKDGQGWYAQPSFSSHPCSRLTFILGHHSTSLHTEETLIYVRFSFAMETLV